MRTCLLPWLWRQNHHQLTLTDNWQLLPNIWSVCTTRLSSPPPNIPPKKGVPLSLSLLTKPVCWCLQKGNNSETWEGESYPHPHQLWGGATGLREQTRGRAEIRRNLWRSPSSTQLTAGLASRLDYMLLWTLPSVKYPWGWRFNKPSEQSAPTQQLSWSTTCTWGISLAATCDKTLALSLCTSEKQLDSLSPESP